MIYLFLEIMLYLGLAALLGYLVATFIYYQLGRRKEASQDPSVEHRVRELLLHIRSLEKENQSIKESKLRLNNQLDQSLEALVQEKTQDDLTLIYGIGPILQETLHRFGVTSYCQLAHLSDSQIAQLAKLIGPFGDRINRDKWVETASAYCESNLRKTM